MERGGYALCLRFFPWIGALIGGCIIVWNRVCGVLQIGGICRAAIELAIPLLLTGGIHADGFLDVMDAVYAYETREQRIKILKDPHIGAFAVIRLALYGLIVLAAFSEIKDPAVLKAVCAGFFLSRCLCGISAVSFPLAKQEGLLFLFAENARRKMVRALLALQGAACVCLMCLWSWHAGLLASAAAAGSMICYYFRSRKWFGGITGDTSGYFILLCEGVITAAAACADILM